MEGSRPRLSGARHAYAHTAAFYDAFTAHHDAMDRAGLECLAVLGQGLDDYAEQPLDDLRHSKAIFIGRHSEGR